VNVGDDKRRTGRGNGVRAPRCGTEVEILRCAEYGCAQDDRGVWEWGFAEDDKGVWEYGCTADDMSVRKGVV